MKPGYETIAHNIKLLREISRETQGEFGKRFGTDQKSVWAYEQGVNKPKSDFLIALSKSTGIPQEILLRKKLKKDVTGKIINIDEEVMLQNARAELNILTKNFEEEVIKFHRALLQFSEKLNSIEKEFKGRNKNSGKRVKPRKRSAA